MAGNVWTSNPYVIDTAEDKTITALIDYFEWHPNAATNDLLIKDENDAILYQVRAAAGAANHESDGIEKSEHLGRWVNTINVETISAGTLYIYTK